MTNCTPHDIIWSKDQAQCSRCGATAPTAFRIQHILTPRERENRYAWSLGNSSTRLTLMVDAKGRPI
jgi:hypothetical protein